jgi:hypothetical protein
MRNLEFRKLIMIGFRFDAPFGAEMRHGDGTPMKVPEIPVRMRFALWIPQRAPFQRRDVRPLSEYLETVQPPVEAGAAVVLDASAASMTADEYREQHLLDLAAAPGGYCMVGDASARELQALRDGVIAEQIQDFTFPRWPQPAEVVRFLMPHWEQRTRAAIGCVPNGAPAQKARSHIQCGGRGVRVAPR